MRSTKQNLTVTERAKLAQLRKHALRVGDATSTPSPSPSPSLGPRWKYGQVILAGLAAVIIIFITYNYGKMVLNFLDPMR